MATHCEVNSARHQHHFISSNAYYGYVPAAPVNNESNSNDNCMDVDFDDCPAVQQMKNKCDGFNGQQQIVLLDNNCCKTKKRTYEKEELTNYAPRSKKFKEEAQNDETSKEYQITLQASINKSSEFGFRDNGDWFSFSSIQRHKEHYQYGPNANEMCRSKLLYLSPPAVFDTAHRPTKQDLKQYSKSNCNEELENMLLLTHGCSSYHHCGEEAEF